MGKPFSVNIPENLNFCDFFLNFESGHFGKTKKITFHENSVFSRYLPECAIFMLETF